MTADKKILDELRMETDTSRQAELRAQILNTVIQSQNNALQHNDPLASLKHVVEIVECLKAKDPELMRAILADTRTIPLHRVADSITVYEQSNKWVLPLLFEEHVSRNTFCPSVFLSLFEDAVCACQHEELDKIVDWGLRQKNPFPAMGLKALQILPHATDLTAPAIARLIRFALTYHAHESLRDFQRLKYKPSWKEILITLSVYKGSRTDLLAALSKEAPTQPARLHLLEDSAHRSIEIITLTNRSLEDLILVDWSPQDEASGKTEILCTDG